MVTCLNYYDDDDYHDDDDHGDYDHDHDDDVDDGVCFYILLARSNFGGSASLANVHPALFCCQIDSMLRLSHQKVGMRKYKSERKTAMSIFRNMIHITTITITLIPH